MRLPIWSERNPSWQRLGSVRRVGVVPGLPGVGPESAAVGHLECHAAGPVWTSAVDGAAGTGRFVDLGDDVIRGEMRCSAECSVTAHPIGRVRVGPRRARRSIADRERRVRAPAVSPPGCCHSRRRRRRRRWPPPHRCQGRHRGCHRTHALGRPVNGSTVCVPVPAANFRTMPSLT